MLNAYLTQTRALLQNPSAPTTLYSDTDLTRYINTMRGQLAGMSQCIRRQGTLTIIAGERKYSFSSILLPFFNTGAPDTGVAQALNVRSVQYAVGSGQKQVYPRPWEWFQLYALNNPVPDSGAPQIWAQDEQGAGNTAGFEGGGTLWFDPIPNISYALTLDCACYPANLVDDTTPESIPYQWTDAVPFGAAWMALLSAQTSARMAEAEKYYNYFQQYIQLARGATNPDVNKYQYEQQPNITLPNQLGMQLPKGGGQ